MSDDTDMTCHAMGSKVFSCPPHKCRGVTRKVTVYYDEDGSYAGSKESSSSKGEYQYCGDALRQLRKDRAVFSYGWGS